jgi:hypothetical protein
MEILAHRPFMLFIGTYWESGTSYITPVKEKMIKIKTNKFRRLEVEHFFDIIPH